MQEFSDEETRRRENALKLQEKLEKVTPELFSEFLYKHGVPVVQCLTCGSEDIGIPQTQTISIGPNGSSQSHYVDFIKLEAGGPPHSLTHYQYRLICNNCGFTSHFAVYPVVKWIEETQGNDA
ncbi:hypothetical protein AB6D37_15085 [Pectobacterium brasiliense]|uniref:hypothetical protein n=1 Tax=Pectobacterium brasiliense TaxID=180957 RepID=UPI003985A7AA